MMALPNVLIFLIDDMGYSDLAAFGSPNVSTPHLDRLVASGIKLTQWISAAPICTPSRAALQTGRYPIRTGCIGNVERYRVLATPANPHGLATSHVSLAAGLRRAGYATGMSGKWHLGINGNEAPSPQDYAFTPTAHGYESYLGSPWTNAPMCAMGDDGIADKYSSAQTFCFLVANTTVVEQPLRVENFTSAITDHATGFIARHTPSSQHGRQPWLFLMAYFHVHTPLFTSRANRGRSRGGMFGDNIEELDDSVGAVMAAVESGGMRNDTIVFMTSDNGPYQEEGWANAGRSNLYDAAGSLIGRLRGGKGQVYEGGIRMPGAVSWPGVIPAALTSNVLVSTMDIFPTALKLAGVSLPPSYPVDGKDMMPLLLGQTNATAHGVLLHYCGFRVVAARVSGRFKVFWGLQRWYTHDAPNASICQECCNGINPWSRPLASSDVIVSSAGAIVSGAVTVPSRAAGSLLPRPSCAAARMAISTGCLPRWCLIWRSTWRSVTPSPKPTGLRAAPQPMPPSCRLQTRRRRKWRRPCTLPQTVRAQARAPRACRRTRGNHAAPAAVSMRSGRTASMRKTKSARVAQSSPAAQDAGAETPPAPTAKQCSLLHAPRPLRVW